MLCEYPLLKFYGSYFCRETDIIKPCVDKESNGQEEDRTYSRQRSASIELGTIPINLTAKGHPSVGVKEVYLTIFQKSDNLYYLI